MKKNEKTTKKQQNAKKRKTTKKNETTTKKTEKGGMKEGFLEAAAVIAPRGNTQMTIGDRSASAALYSPQGGLE